MKALRIYSTRYGQHRLHRCCPRCTAAGREGMDAADWHRDWRRAGAIGFAHWLSAAAVFALIVGGS